MSHSETNIQKLYIGVFGRPADPAGMNYWQDSSLTYSGVADVFIQHSNFGGMSVKQQISTLYINFLGRQVDFAGLNYWEGQINKGQITIGGVMASMALGVSASDQQTVNNKLYAASVFDAHIDTTAEAIAYMYGDNVDMVAAIAKSWLSKVNGSYSSVDNAVRNVDATLANIVKAAGMGFAQEQGLLAEHLHAVLLDGHDQYGVSADALYANDMVSLVGTVQSGDVGSIVLAGPVWSM